ncbi:MAG TPA: cupin domain-containing protein [Thermoanaerobaculia bacterium]
MAVITSLDELRAGRVLRGEAIAMRAFDGPATVRPATDEVLYVLEKDEGIFVPAGAEVTIDRGTVLSVAAGLSPPGEVERVRLAGQPIQKTGDRWYRELIQSEITQFVGSIPPGRAPDHFHLYEEVLCILMGSGFLWADGTRTPIGAGACVYLPKRQVHCVENSGSGELRLVGVFYPAGSPAARYNVEDRAGQRPGGG